MKSAGLRGLNITRIHTIIHLLYAQAFHNTIVNRDRCIKEFCLCLRFENAHTSMIEHLTMDFE